MRTHAKSEKIAFTLLTAQINMTEAMFNLIYCTGECLKVVFFPLMLGCFGQTHESSGHISDLPRGLNFSPHFYANMTGADMREVHVECVEIIAGSM